jgi:hypothetical protein
MRLLAKQNLASLVILTTLSVIFVLPKSVTWLAIPFSLYYPQPKENGTIFFFPRVSRRLVAK